MRRRRRSLNIIRHAEPLAGWPIGLIAAPILIVTGIMICLTGWGILLGLPVIVAGILAPLAGPLLGMSEHAAKCPVLRDAHGDGS